MKAKFIYNITLGVFLIGLAAGCEDYLTEDPPSEISLENVTDDTVEGLMIGLYEPMTRSRGRVWESNLGVVLAGLEEATHNKSASSELMNNYDFVKGGKGYNSAWPTMYEAIGRANILLDKLSTNDLITESLKNQAIGEASFVRAMNYYTIVRGWGSVPMRLVPVINSSETGQPLESVDNIYAQIISDLSVAESNLPAITGNPGRATSGAAKVALADVYLTRGNFEAARDKSKEVMDHASDYGYALVASYQDIFSPTAPTNSEDVFSLKFSQYVGLGTFMAVKFAPTTPNTLAKDAGIAPRGLEDGAANSSAPLIAGWDDNDLRKSWTLYNEVTIDGVTIPVAPATPGADYFYGKYKDPTAVEETAAGNDWYLYRYADALLIFAESENKVNGPTAEAYDAVNQIRRRAYGVDLGTPNASVDFPAGLNQSEFDDLIFQERGYEFMVEGKRWFDLVRTGRWQTIIPAANKQLPTKLTWDIPDSEIQNNPALRE